VESLECTQCFKSLKEKKTEFVGEDCTKCNRKIHLLIFLSPVFHREQAVLDRDRSRV